MPNHAGGIKEISYHDCPGGGQVVVENGIAYIGHMGERVGTSIVDVGDARKPKALARIDVPAGVHAHKVRVGGELMVVNREIMRPDDEALEMQGGLGIFDVSDPSKPRQICFWKTHGKGIHRFDFDGRYAYISPTVQGYVGNIVMILDLDDPANPREVGRWWMPGQWLDGDETPTWEGTLHRCHHPLRMGNRLYVSYWHGGFVILDIEDMGKPRFVSGFDWSPPFSWPTHTALPIPFDIQGRRIMVVADEDVARLGLSYPSFLWLVDISDETRPMPFASFQVEGIDGSAQPEYTGCHQPCEKVTGTEIPVAWFAHGLRIVDIANPHAPREVASYMPPVPEGEERVQSNDVTVDDRGLIYLLDRGRGLHILERV
jgi:hypothetical protein